MGPRLADVLAVVLLHPHPPDDPGRQLDVDLFASCADPTAELRVYMMLSGCLCGCVLCPGWSVYSRTRTRSFSKRTRYDSGLVTVGSRCTWVRSFLSTPLPSLFPGSPRLSEQPGGSGGGERELECCLGLEDHPHLSTVVEI
jgi:hypothetical protein